MRQEGKVSKVAVCERCDSMIMCAHVDYLNKESEKEFTELSNDGFIIKLETILETKGREFGDYKDCSKGNCN